MPGHGSHQLLCETFSSLFRFMSVSSKLLHLSCQLLKKFKTSTSETCHFLVMPTSSAELEEEMLNKNLSIGFHWIPLTLCIWYNPFVSPLERIYYSYGASYWREHRKSIGLLIRFDLLLASWLMALFTDCCKCSGKQLSLNVYFLIDFQFAISTLPKNKSRSSSSNISSLYEFEYVPGDQLPKTILPLINPYEYFAKRSSAFSVKGVRELIKSSGYGICPVQQVLALPSFRHRRKTISLSEYRG